jgi:hypothetical protein
MSSASLIPRIVAAIEHGEIPLSLAIEIDAPGRLDRAWASTKATELLLGLLFQTRPDRLSLREWARAAAHFSGIDDRVATNVLNGDRLPVGKGVHVLDPMDPQSWAWSAIRRAVGWHGRRPHFSDLYDMRQAKVPELYVIGTLLRPHGPPTLAEILAAASEQMLGTYR